MSLSASARSAAPGEAVFLEDGGEVEEGAGGGGDRDGVVGGHLVGSRSESQTLRLGRCTSRGAVISIVRRLKSRMPQSAAADRWLSAAPGPAARTAASQLRRVSRRCPTAYTPRWTTWRCPRRWSRVMVCRPTPSANNWRRAATPCWRLARAAIATVGASDRIDPNTRLDSGCIVHVVPRRAGIDARPRHFAGPAEFMGACHISASCSPAPSSRSPRSRSPPSPRRHGRLARRPTACASSPGHRLQPVRPDGEPVPPHGPPRGRRRARAPAGRPSARTFDADIGPDSSGNPELIYQRCAAGAGVPRAATCSCTRSTARPASGRSATRTTPTTTTRTRRSGAGGSRGRATMARAASRTRSSTRRR